ncbi:MAG: hypothetical protein RL562_1292 [Planctomycetota bacterium]|jgi:CelD/BcsL family acetyltransferase involved in cellulose biosynthesis
MAGSTDSCTAAADAVWTRLAHSTPAADPFSCGPAWQRSCLEAFHDGAELFVRHDDERLAAFALFQDEGHAPFLGPPDRGWRFGRTLLGAGAEELLLDLLNSLGGAVSSVLLSGMERADPDAMWMLLDLVARTRDHAMLHVSDTKMAHASLRGGYDGYWSRRSPKFRRDVRRCRRRAEREGVTFERCVPRSLADAGAAYRRMCALDDRSWKGRMGDGIGGAGSHHFYLRLLERLATSSDARVVFARARDHDIGFVFGGLAGAVYRGQQFSFDEAWFDLSIGNLLQDQMLAWLCEEGIERYDMGPEMPYMRRFAEGADTHSSFLLRF